MPDSVINLISRYSLWVGCAALMVSLGAGLHSCSTSIYGAGSTIATKAEAAKVHALEVKMGQLEECLKGLSGRMERMDKKLDRLLER